MNTPNGRAEPEAIEIPPLPGGVIHHYRCDFRECSHPPPGRRVWKTIRSEGVVRVQPDPMPGCYDLLRGPLQDRVHEFPYDSPAGSVVLGPGTKESLESTPYQVHYEPLAPGRKPYLRAS